MNKQGQPDHLTPFHLHIDIVNDNTTKCDDAARTALQALMSRAQEGTGLIHSPRTHSSLA